MCAVAKAITLNTIWTRDFTCKLCLLRQYYLESILNEPTGNEVTVVKWAWFVLKIRPLQSSSTLTGHPQCGAGPQPHSRIPSYPPPLVPQYFCLQQIGSLPPKSTNNWPHISAEGAACLFVAQEHGKRQQPWHKGKCFLRSSWRQVCEPEFAANTIGGIPR